MAEDQEAEAKRLEQLTTARRYINLARVYVERKQLVVDKIERWAVEWAAKLWEPHKVWKGRYGPCASPVEAPRWGVATTFSIPNSLCPMAGSTSKTSRAAPATCPDFKAS